MAGKGDKEHKVVKEIKADLPTPAEGEQDVAGSERATPARSRIASRSASNPRPAREENTPVKAREVPAKIEEHDEDTDGRLGKRDSSLRPAKHEDNSGPEESLLQKKINAFLDKLKSEDRKDVEDNARMLAKFVQHFACNFSVTTSDILKIMEQQTDGIDINKVRASFIKNMQ